MKARRHRYHLQLQIESHGLGWGHGGGLEEVNGGGGKDICNTFNNKGLNIIKYLDDVE